MVLFPSGQVIVIALVDQRKLPASIKYNFFLHPSETLDDEQPPAESPRGSIQRLPLAQKNKNRDKSSTQNVNVYNIHTGWGTCERSDSHTPHYTLSIQEAGRRVGKIWGCRRGVVKMINPSLV